MARDKYVKEVTEIWASSALAEADVEQREGEQDLVFTRGFDDHYEQNAGSKVTREQFNWHFRASTALAKEINENGALLEWDMDIPYTERARVIGSNGVEYKAVQASTGQDPVADTSNTHWERMIPVVQTVPTATTTRQGTVEFASAAEVSAGTSTNRVTSVANVTSMVSGAVQGRLLPASDGTTGQFLGHDGTYRDLPSGVGPATQTALGTVEYASDAEVSAGTATNRVPSVANVTTMISGATSNRLLPAADGTAGQFLGHDGTYRTLPTVLHPPATETFVGTVELATQTEAEAGTSSSVVPTVNRVTQQVNALIPENRKVPAVNGTARQFLSHDGTYADLPAASQTESGAVELATVNEVEAAAADRVVSPSVLPIKKVVTYTASEEIAAANVAGTLHLRAG